MNTQTLSYLLTIREYGSLRKAADVLFITSSALSQCVSAEEKRLGFPLFDRTDKSFRPTKKGEVYLSYAQRILDVQNRTMQRIREPESHSWFQTVRVCMSYTFYGYFINTLVPELEQRFPDLRFELHPMHSEPAREHLLGNLCEFAVYSLPLSGHSILEESAFSEATYMAMVSVNTPFLGDPGSLDSYRNANFVLLRSGSRVRDIQNRILAQNGCRPDPRRIIEVDNFRSARAMIPSTKGVSVLPPQEIEDKENLRLFPLPFTYTYHNILASGRFRPLSPELAEVRGIILARLSERIGNGTPWRW